ncbi:hypothetical protein L195_g004972 [Trifolium pratense]|uniref:Uncharacterized protein n=1 Tax=Trifolium pratense TaxID=57577 RepID=A0A2K3NZK7_TRIPR|nr:hypothetical protein L195_g004972 [Trifolium pratense]
MAGRGCRREEGMKGEGDEVAWEGRRGFWLCKKKSQLTCESVVPCDLSEEDFCEPHHRISGKNDGTLADNKKFKHSRLFKSSLS